MCLLPKYTIVNISVATIKNKVGGHIGNSRQYKHDYFFFTNSKSMEGPHLTHFVSLVFGDLPIVDKHPVTPYAYITVLMCC